MNDNDRPYVDADRVPGDDGTEPWADAPSAPGAEGHGPLVDPVADEDGDGIVPGSPADVFTDDPDAITTEA